MKRLEAIASKIIPCKVFADIGCDHGIIGLYVVKNNLAERVCECDISEDSLGKARALIGDDAEYFSGDGFVPLTRTGIETDQAVIAGMGGELIIKILENCPNKPRLILGAQKNTDKLRVYLIKNGYRIEEDHVVFDSGKFYDIIVAEEGEGEMPDEISAFAGVYYKQKNDDLKKWCDCTEKRISQYKRTEKNQKIIDMIHEVKKWQR